MSCCVMVPWGIILMDGLAFYPLSIPRWIPTKEYTSFQNDTDSTNVFVMFGLNIFRALLFSGTVIAEVKLWSYMAAVLTSALAAYI